MIDTGKPEIEILPGSIQDEVRMEIYSNLRVLYATQTGELALDRDYGIDSASVDFPQENAKALLAAEYVRKTQKYEPRASVARVEWLADNEKGILTPKVVIELV